ncbi:MAG: winged helix-turn-helix domain-containing protein [Burkholderiales bacterium]|nr:winged helix-turn-helix domain-containing protein [Burkholderiales bacterium]
MTPYRFEHFDLVPAHRQVLANGQVVPLGGRAYDLLLLLIEHRDRVVGKDELLARVWAGQVVEENNLTVQIAALRKALGSETIATVSGRGYRFTANDAAANSAPATLQAQASGNPLERPALALPNIPSIAVLPFENLSGDPSQDYFADGMVEDIITALARMKAFFVIARNSSFVYRGRAVDIKTVGRELGVRYVLEGSVRRAGERLRITGQLIDASDGHHVWADRFDGGIDDIFALQDQITDAIALALEPSIRRAEFERTRLLPTSNLQAYDLGWRALAKLRPNTTRADNDEALSLVARAVQLDPNFAGAQALGALACVTRLTQGYGDAGDMKTGLHYAERAFEANTDDPTVLCLAGLALGSLGLRASGVPDFGFRYNEATRAIERALELSPNLIMVQYCAGYLRLILGEADASLAHYARCARISPLDPMKSVFVAGEGNSHLLAGRHEQALAAGKRAVEESPNYPVGHRVVTAALGFLGRIDEARVAARRMLKLSPRFTVSSYESRVPYRSAEFRARIAAVYRAAGVPG